MQPTFSGQKVVLVLYEHFTSLQQRDKNWTPPSNPGVLLTYHTEARALISILETHLRGGISPSRRLSIPASRGLQIMIKSPEYLAGRQFSYHLTRPNIPVASLSLIIMLCYFRWGRAVGRERHTNRRDSHQRSPEENVVRYGGMCLTPHKPSSNMLTIITLTLAQ